MQHYALDIAVLVQVRPAAVPSEYQFWYKLNIELIIYDVIAASKAAKGQAGLWKWGQLCSNKKWSQLLYSKILAQKRNFHTKRIYNLQCEFSPSLSFSVSISWKHCKVGTGILGRQTNTSKKSMEGNFVKCFSSPTEHALLETSQQLLSRFQTARTNIALFHNVYNLNIFFLHRYQCLTGFQKTRWRAFIQRLQRIMCPHGPIGRHHPRYICGAWRRTSGGRFLNHQKHQHYAGQCLTNHGQTFSEVSNGNRATCGIFPRRVAQLT